jgi:2-polyprenyl-6-methoxyphenol hydroxylase-like FAD-dependent oxidoreductase
MGPERVDIVGAGPVGLVTALCALERGIQPVVYERRPALRSGSRSIGVHPPSLELLERLGLAQRFVERGVRVERGVAVGRDGVIGAVDFGACFGRHRYVLSVPQAVTESLLREALEKRAPGAIVRRDFDPATDARPEAAALIACDGKHSRVRKAAGIGFEGGAYEGSYAMADFPDTTPFGTTAAVFLGRGGLIESFPLPARMRRWVIRRSTPSFGEVTSDELVETVRERTSYRLAADDAVDLNGFHAEHYIASAFAQGRTALAGDAAHIVSPIGGQGMNLGWLGAAELVADLSRALDVGESVPDALARNQIKRRRMARAAGRRAEANMWLGRPTERAAARERVVSALLRGPTQKILANLFTMRGLASGF